MLPHAGCKVDGGWLLLSVPGALPSAREVLYPLAAAFARSREA